MTFQTVTQSVIIINIISDFSANMLNTEYNINNNLNIIFSTLLSILYSKLTWLQCCCCIKRLIRLRLKLSRYKD